MFVRFRSFCCFSSELCSSGLFFFLELGFVCILECVEHKRSFFKSVESDSSLSDFTKRSEFLKHQMPLKSV